MPEYRDPQPPYQGPDFADVADEAPAETPADSPPTAPAAAPATPPRPRSPWPGRIAGGIVILAIVAILIAVFLPRERQENQPQAGQTLAQNPANNPQTPYSNPQQWETNQQPNTDLQQSPTPQEQDTSQPSTGWQQQPNPSPGQYPQPSQNPSPSPSDTQQPSPQADDGQASAPSPSPSPSPGPGPSNLPSPSPAPSPRPSPSPRTAPQPARAPQPAFTQRQAQQLLVQVEDSERQQMWGALGTLVAMLRRPEYQEPENWELMQTALATTGTAMIPGGMQEGHGEIIAIINNSRNGAQAATRLEQSVRQWSLPRKVEAQIVQILATATDYNSAVSGLDRVLRSTNTQLSQQTLQGLQNNIAWAYNHQAGIRQQYGR